VTYTYFITKRLSRKQKSLPMSVLQEMNWQISRSSGQYPFSVSKRHRLHFSV